MGGHDERSTRLRWLKAALLLAVLVGVGAVADGMLGGACEQDRHSRTSAADYRLHSYRHTDVASDGWILQGVYSLRRVEAEGVGDGLSNRADGQDGGQTGPSIQRLPGSSDPAETWIVTRYGESYEDSPLGCGGGDYHSADPTIIAVAWPDSPYPCGQKLYVCAGGNERTDVVGAEGVVRSGTEVLPVRCILGTVVGHCPGCGPRHLDLSEAGMAVLCGVRFPATCDFLSGLSVSKKGE